MNWEKKFTNFIGSRSSVILHTVFFILMFLLPFFGIRIDTILLVLTTLVSLEAIYLAIFIQISVNENTQSLHEVEEDIDEIKLDVDEIQEDVDEISTDIDEIESGLDEIQQDAEEDDKNDADEFDGIKEMLEKLLQEVDRLKQSNKK